MRILLINTSERTGGAAIACLRLMGALRRFGISAKMLVRDKQTDRLSVVNVRHSMRLAMAFLWERFVIFVANRLSRKNIFGVDIANMGVDVTQMHEFKSADVIHLHWVNQGFLSLRNMEAIVRSRKPIVVTLHDQWYFTGICHYSADCDRYATACHDCPQLGNGKAWMDLSRKVFEHKLRIYKDANITFVGCSRWMADLARKSALTQGHTVVSIPNAIDTEVFCPKDKMDVRLKQGLPRDMRLILFGAQRITDERKGFRYLAEACELIKQRDPELAKRMCIVVVGGDSAKVQGMLPVATRPVNYVSDQTQMVELYNAMDLYVTPSLQDNLPNTIVEAMACGVPCVGFNAGGIPEMIDHKQNGYVAEYKNAEDFAEGILWALSTEYKTLSGNARQKALETYSEEAVAKKYKEIYDNACNRHL